MKVGLIYLIKNLKNNKQYIGITTRPIETRVYDHIYKSKYKRETNTHLINAFNKYGVENFTIKILEQIINNDSKELLKKLHEREIYYIRLFNTKIHGYNSTDGGEGFVGYIHTKQTLDKIKNTQKDFSKCRENYERQKIENHNHGIFNKLEKQRIVTSKILINSGYRLTEQRKKELLNGSIRTKQEVSELQKILHKNKKHNDITKQKISEKSKKQNKEHQNVAVVAYDLNNNVVGRFESITLASKTLNVSMSKISQVCKGTREKTKGFIFRYE